MVKGTREFEVMLYDAGPDKKATVRSLFNYMQATADSHSRSLGTSLGDFADKNLTWVYSRHYTKIIAMPCIYERIYCETWRSGFNRHFVRRDFNIFGSKGEKLAEAAASLALIDLNNRKPVEIPGFIKDQLEPEKGEAVPYNFPSIESIDSYDYIYTSQVRYEDIDVNKHMNNASYAQVIFESVPDGFKSRYELKSMDINFRGEAFAGDLLECMIKKEAPGIFLHKIIAGNEKKVILNARSEWRGVEKFLKKQ
jgi:medium-chain acyl-[acyl-carrier-protein] hydrolase